MGMPAARVGDLTSHGPPLAPGIGSTNVFIGGKPAWRALPAAMGMALNAAQKVADAIIKTAESATIASDPLTKAGFLAAETAAKAAATAALTALMNGMGAACVGLTLGKGSPDKHMCTIPTAPAPVPHGMGMVIDGSGCVLTNGLPQSAQGDKVLEALGGPDPIALGQINVLVGKCGGGGGLFAAVAALVQQAIDSALAAANAVAAFVKDAVAFVKGLVQSVIDKVVAAARQITQAVVDAVVNGLKKLAKAVTDALKPKPVTTGLGKDVDDLAAKSPTLQDKLRRLQDKGWTIKYGPKGGGTKADRGTKEIIIDENDKGNAKAVTQGLAHEAGHADYTLDPYVPPEGHTKKEYVDGNVKRSLKDEGEATMTNADVRREIKDNGGEDIGIAGAQPDKYQEIADKYPDKADRDKARSEIGDAFAKGEQPSGDENKGKNYEQYYGEFYEKQYDKATKK